MSTSPNLNLPFVAAGQAQKHVTVNEAVLAIDSLMHIAVDGSPAATPPAAPEQGSRWIVGEAATGDWTGHDGKLAVFLDGGWRFHAPRAGWLAHVSEDHDLIAFDGAAWSPLEQPDSLQDLILFGLGTTADASNPLSVRLNNALFTALPAGSGGDGDLRIKANKEAVGDTASVLFQTGYSGRAEIGALGSDDLSLKVSSDGSAWSTALTATGADGVVRLPCNPKFRASASADLSVAADVWTRAPFNLATYDPLSDFDTANHAYVVPVEGFYVFNAQIGHTSDGTPPTIAYGAFFVNGAIAEESEMRAAAVNSGRGLVMLTLARYLSAGAEIDVRLWLTGADSNFGKAESQFWGFMIP